MALQWSMEPTRLYIHEVRRAHRASVSFACPANPDQCPTRLPCVLWQTFQEMVSMVEMTYTLQWEDERLFRHPCYGAPVMSDPTLTI